MQGNVTGVYFEGRCCQLSTYTANACEENHVIVGTDSDLCLGMPASLCRAARGMTWMQDDPGHPAPRIRDSVLPKWAPKVFEHFYTMQTLEDRCFSILYMCLFTFWFDHKIP